MTEETKNVFKSSPNPVFEFDEVDDLIEYALKNGDALATLTEDQMLIQVKGVSINSKPRRDGRFQGCVAHSDGKKYFYGSTREEVAFKIKLYLKEERTKEREPKEKKKKEAYCPTFEEFAKKWIETYKRPNLKPASVLGIENSLKPAYAAFGKRQLKSISTDDVQELLLSIAAPRMRDVCKITLNQIFKKALVQRIIKYNPCDAVEIKKYKSAHKNALTVDEQAVFLEAAKESSHGLLYRFLLATGLRIGEALALTPSDFGKDSVTVNKNVVYLSGKRIAQDTPKSTSGNRTVPVSEALVEEILSHSTGDGPVFPISYNAAKLGIDRIAKKTGLSVTLHVLRHTYATRLEEAGIPPRVKQYLMGHATIQMTQGVYTDIQQKYVESLSESIKKLF